MFEFIIGLAIGIASVTWLTTRHVDDTQAELTQELNALNTKLENVLQRLGNIERVVENTQVQIKQGVAPRASK